MMTTDKYLRQFNTAKEAYDSTREPMRIAVKRITYIAEGMKDVEYYSYISDYEDPKDLIEDFPYCVWSNQSIVEITQED